MGIRTRSRFTAAILMGAMLSYPAPAYTEDPKPMAAASSQPADASPGELKLVAGPMFTPDSSNSITVWLQTNRPGAIHITASPLTGKDGKPFAGGAQEVDVETTAADRNIGVARVMYRPGVRYAVIVKAKGSDKPLSIDEITAPPAPGEPGKYRMMFGSCSHQERNAKQPIWHLIAQEKPQVFLFIGDNMYLPNSPDDFPKSREAVRELYRDTYDEERQKPEMQKVLRSTMSYAIWDDHDFGNNNSDRTWKWPDVALESLMMYFPNVYGSGEASGCFHRFSWGDVDVFMLDDRTFRDPNGDKNRKTMFGEKQLEWLKSGLAASKASFKVIANGNQMLAEGHPHESWGVQNKAERDAFLDWLWDNKVTGVIFLSGDRHFAELIRMSDPKKRGADVWDLTSSPLANDVYKDGRQEKNPGRVEHYVGGVNVGQLDFDTTARPPKVTMKILDRNGAPVIYQDVTAGKP